MEIRGYRYDITHRPGRRRDCTIPGRPEETTAAGPAGGELEEKIRK